MPVLSFRMSDEAYEGVALLAAKHGLSMSKVLNALLFNRLPKVSKATGLNREAILAFRKAVSDVVAAEMATTNSGM